jgi:hypothetical protein
MSKPKIYVFLGLIILALVGAGLYFFMSPSKEEKVLTQMERQSTSIDRFKGAKVRFSEDGNKIKVTTYPNSAWEKDVVLRKDEWGDFVGEMRSEPSSAEMTRLIGESIGRRRVDKFKVRL